MSTPENNSLGGLEKSLEELEALVARLEGGDLPLELLQSLLRKTEQAEPSAFTPPADGE